MDCNYCGNSYLTEDPHCAGCGSPRTARKSGAANDADALYAKVGQALMTSTPDKSRALLDAIIGSPEKDPKKLRAERTAKIGMVLGLLYFFPMVLGGIAAMAIPFLIFFYLPYHGLRSVVTWINGDTVRR